MTTLATFPLCVVRNELRRRKAVQYLRAHGIYRGDLDCGHRYEPHDPRALQDTSVVVTVCKVVSNITVNHATRA